MTHPKIMEAQVIGAYDEVYGEEICACIQLCAFNNVIKSSSYDVYFIIYIIKFILLLHNY